MRVYALPRPIQALELHDYKHDLEIRTQLLESFSHVVGKEVSNPD